MSLNVSYQWRYKMFPISYITFFFFCSSFDPAILSSIIFRVSSILDGWDVIFSIFLHFFCFIVSRSYFPCIRLRFFFLLWNLPEVYTTSYWLRLNCLMSEMLRLCLFGGKFFLDMNFKKHSKWSVM